MIKLRPHHLLCLSLFEGKGYDNAFAANMADVLKQLAAEGCFTLTEGHDAICSACPNLTAQADCALGEIAVQKMDRAVAEILKLKENGQYDYRQVARLLRETVTEEFFQACCGGCRWHHAQACSYQKLTEKLLAK